MEQAYEAINSILTPIQRERLLLHINGLTTRQITDIESINVTLAPDGELRLTIMASLAQEESRKTSERVKWGQRRQMEKGVVFGRDMLGYDVHNGKLYINEEGAEIVKLIFHKFVNEKKGTCTMGRELREQIF